MFKPITESTRSNLEFMFTCLAGAGVVIVAILQVIRVLFSFDLLKGLEAGLLILTGISLIVLLICKFYPKSKIVDKSKDSEVR